MVVLKGLCFVGWWRQSSFMLGCTPKVDQRLAGFPGYPFAQVLFVLSATLVFLAIQC